MTRGQDHGNDLFGLFLNHDGVLADDEADAPFVGATKQVECTVENAVPLLIAAVFARSGVDDHSLNAGCDCEMIDIG
ncbi:MAG TPA: hypothetical protein VM869_14945 [Enhygromyxa sp.]|nr:hypothetical protein [Enhygromyxa sp.]